MCLYKKLLGCTTDAQVQIVLGLNPASYRALRDGKRELKLREANILALATGKSLDEVNKILVNGK